MAENQHKFLDFLETTGMLALNTLSLKPLNRTLTYRFSTTTAFDSPYAKATWKVNLPPLGTLTIFQCVQLLGFAWLLVESQPLKRRPRIAASSRESRAALSAEALGTAPLYDWDSHARVVDEMARQILGEQPQAPTNY